MKINNLTKKQIMRVAHRLTKIIVGNTNVDYKAQFNLCLNFVRFNSVQEIIRVFILWVKGNKYMLRLKENMGVATEMGKTGFYFVASYGKDRYMYELYVNKDRHCILVHKAINFFQLIFVDRKFLNCFLANNDYEFMKHYSYTVECNINYIADYVNNYKKYFTNK